MKAMTKALLPPGSIRPETSIWCFFSIDFIIIGGASSGRGEIGVIRLRVLDSWLRGDRAQLGSPPGTQLPPSKQLNHSGLITTSYDQRYVVVAPKFENFQSCEVWYSEGRLIRLEGWGSGGERILNKVLKVAGNMGQELNGQI